MFVRGSTAPATESLLSLGTSKGFSSLCTPGVLYYRCFDDQKYGKAGGRSMFLSASPQKSEQR